MSRQRAFVLMVALAAAVAGCGPSFGPQARYGVTFYCPGAGNIDFGDNGVRSGLEKAGYRGQVASILWTVSLNPAIDQLVKENARLGAIRLSRYIQEYLDRFPGREVNLVGLSAGTGVAIWALERLRPRDMVNNVVLLSSSLSSTYDVSKALKHVKGKIYVFYSPNDVVLAGPMKVFGTIDGKLFTDGAGSVGLQGQRAAGGRVVNIAWRPEFSRYGYSGGHLDSTSPDFIRAHVAPLLITARAAPPPGTKPATGRETGLQAGHQD